MDDFLYGFPPSPLFYLNYHLKNLNPDQSLEANLSELNSQINDSNDLIFDYSKLNCFEGPLPPAPPAESWYSFGVQEKFQEEEYTLDSETLIPPGEDTTDLRSHFKRLYSQFVNSLITYLDLLKNMNTDSISEIKKFIKLYVNLQYILSSLWRRQAEEDVLNMLKEQLRRRRKYIDSMKLVLLQVKDTIKKNSDPNYQDTQAQLNNLYMDVHINDKEEIKTIDTL